MLEELHREVPGAVVIGGWASYLRVRQQKSHDIDLIVDMPAMAILRQKHQLESRGHLGGRKYKATIREIGVDVYAAHQSELGSRLHLPVEALLRYTETVDGHLTLEAEALFVAKMAALLDRPDTLPGNKDRVEMLALLRDRPTDWRSERVAEVLSQTRLAPSTRRELVAEAFDFLGEASGLTRNDKQLLKSARQQVDVALVRSVQSRLRSDEELER